jgi:hypothetical protein
MAISSGTQDYREPGLGAGGSSSGGADSGAAVEAAVNPAGGRLPIDFQPSVLDNESAMVPVVPGAAVDEVIIPETPVQAATAELGEVAGDTVKLLELQLQLFEAELKQSALRLVQPLWMFLAATACGTASLMVVFHAFGWALHDYCGLSVSLSLFIVAVAGGALTAITLQMVKQQLRVPRISFAKTKAEMMRNVGCFANILRSPKP